MRHSSELYASCTGPVYGIPEQKIFPLFPYKTSTCDQAACTGTHGGPSCMFLMHLILGRLWLE